MIYDRFDRLAVYYDSVPYLKEICEELQTKDFTKLPVGTYYTEKSGIKYMVQSYETVADKKPEVHRKYADLQFVIEGKEKFGFASICPLPESFSEDDDFGLYDDELESNAVLNSGDAVIVFPYEPHTPGLSSDGPCVMKKIVAKIPM